MDVSTFSQWLTLLSFEIVATHSGVYVCEKHYEEKSPALGQIMPFRIFTSALYDI